jgi:hypothetical protein
MKIADVAKIFWATFSHGESYVLILTKRGSATFLGDFFTITSVINSEP